MRKTTCSIKELASADSKIFCFVSVGASKCPANAKQISTAFGLFVTILAMFLGIVEKILGTPSRALLTALMMASFSTGEIEGIGSIPPMAE